MEYDVAQAGRDIDWPGPLIQFDADYNIKEIETWVQALDAYDSQEFEEALRQFDQIADTSKILFNCGVIYATLGEHDKAVRSEVSNGSC